MIEVIQSNALHIPLPDGVVQCVITSPPYFGLRDYGTAKWEGGDSECDHIEPRGSILGKRSDTFHGSNTQEAHNIAYKNTCGKCGARRVDAQIGLEPTPEAYVTNIVAVMRECWRVMREDATLWLNLGDSYSGSSMSGGDQTKWVGGGTNQLLRQHEQNKHIKMNIPNGLKPKDLIGIPWRVAFALQQPWYSGKILSEADRIWLAAMIDGEGCMFIHKRKIGQSNGQGYTRKHDSFGAGLEVANTHISIIERCQQITGIGSISHQDKESQLKNRNMRLYRWNVRSNECRNIVREVYPYLVAKKHEARLLLGCPPSGEQAERAHVGLINLHNGREADIDFQEPKSMYERGWYLRSDIIWSKSNPMPESVTDRPTKSHEYVFLLAKQERYYYDAEAVREDLSPISKYQIELANRGEFRDSGEVKQTYNRQGSGHFGSDGPGGAHRGAAMNPAGRNRRTVWTIATSPFSGAHFATFPPALVEPMILAGTSPQACEHCGAAWERVIEKQQTGERLVDGSFKTSKAGSRSNVPGSEIKSMTSCFITGLWNESITTGWRPTCQCPDNTGSGKSLVLDPFSGSGTVGRVCAKLGRSFVGGELNPAYIELAQHRTSGVQIAALL